MRYCNRCRASGRDCGVHDVDWMISKGFGTPSGTDSRDRKISFPGTSSAVYSDVSSCPISLDSLEKIDDDIPEPPDMPDDGASEDEERKYAKADKDWERDYGTLTENTETEIGQILKEHPGIKGKDLMELLNERFGVGNPEVAKVIKKMIRRQRRLMAEKGDDEEEISEEMDLEEHPEDADIDWESDDFEEQLRENEKSLEPYYLKHTINLGSEPIEFSDVIEKAAQTDTQLKSMKERRKLANVVNRWYDKGYFPGKTLSGRASKYVEETTYELTGDS